MTDHESAVLSQGDLDATFSALADSTRRAILERLTTGEASVTELAEPFDISLPAVSRHLKVLERARLIERRRDAQWRWCRLRPEPLRQAADWIRQYRRFWQQQLNSLERWIDAAQAEAGADDENGGGPDA